jgi:diguanylate cyclase (GGDEF)-like protein
MSLFVTMLFVVTTATVATILLYSIEDDMRRNLVQQQADALQRAALNLDEGLAERRELLRIASAGMPGPAAEDRYLALRFLESQAVLLTEFDRLHLFAPDGTHLADFPVDPARPLAETADYDFIIPSAETARSFISKPYQSVARDEAQLIFMTEPVLDGQGFVVAVMVGTIDLSRPNFISRLAQTPVGANGRYHLSTGSRINLVHENGDRVGQVFPPPGRDPLFDRALQGWEGVEEQSDAAGAHKLTGYRWLHKADWLLGASFPTKEVFSPIGEARKQVLGWALLFGLATAPLVWLATQRLIAPLGVLRDTIRACRESPDKSFPAIIEQNEIGELAQEFNDMMVARSRAEQYARHLANHDALTGLPNRSVAEDRIMQALAHSKRDGQHSAVLICDLDHFKKINESLGPVAGDAVLVEVASRLKTCVRDSDTVARLGSDEFIVLLSKCDGPNAAALTANRIVQALVEPIVIHAHRLHVSVSIGMALFPEDGKDVNDLLQAAHVAMYHAKEFGRGNYQFFTSAMNSNAKERLNLENRLRGALERREIEVHYQPQVDLAKGRIIGLEALARWNSSEGPISPATFIPLAEDTGLIIPIGEWILRESCKQTVAWQRAGHRDFTISVNVSARQFQRADFAETVAGILEQTGLSAASLVLELTESVIMDHEQKSMSTLERLSAMGVQLSLDDFGTGYSSLSYLKRFPLQKLKIDRSFIRDIYSDPDDAAIVRAILTMAGSLGLEVVAEGVETREQVDFLRALGCYSAQGFFYSRPLPAQKLLEKLEALPAAA